MLYNQYLRDYQRVQKSHTWSLVGNSKACTCHLTPDAVFCSLPHCISTSKITFLGKPSPLYIVYSVYSILHSFGCFLEQLVESGAFICSLAPVLVIISNGDWGYEWRWRLALTCLVKDWIILDISGLPERISFGSLCRVLESYSVTNPAEGEQNTAFHFLQVSAGCTVFSPELLTESVTMVKKALSFPALLGR